jgi:hypothetical protein
VTLSSSSLASALQNTFANMPASASAAATSLAANYYDYATAGMFGASAPQIPTANRDALKTTLLAAIAVPAAGSPPTIAAAWAAGLAAFWLGVPVAGAQAGATVACPGAASLTASLTVVFANLANTAAVCAQALATALHTATMTVTAAVAPPPGTVLPIA